MSRRSASCLLVALVVLLGLLAPFGASAQQTGQMRRIGDAAGYSNPLIGQGLSLALRDARVLSEILLTTDRWSPRSLWPYAEERRKRAQRVRFTAALMAELYASFGPEHAERRGRFLSRLADPDFRGRALLASLAVGPDRSPEWAYTDEFRKGRLK